MLTSLALESADVYRPHAVSTDGFTFLSIDSIPALTWYGWWRLSLLCGFAASPGPIFWGCSALSLNTAGDAICTTDKPIFDFHTFLRMSTLSRSSLVWLRCDLRGSDDRGHV